MNRTLLLPAIRAGKVSEATIDEKVRRILRTAIRFGWMDRDQTDTSIPRLNADGDQVALEGARSGMVLLKNDGNLLPLDKGKNQVHRRDWTGRLSGTTRWRRERRGSAIRGG